MSSVINPRDRAGIARNSPILSAICHLSSARIEPAPPAVMQQLGAQPGCELYLMGKLSNAANVTQVQQTDHNI
jgi:hypothetical protein